MDGSRFPEERLRAEADFQNRRVEAEEQGEVEAREKYYYLQEQARRHYDSELSQVEGLRVLVAGCSEGQVTPLARRGAIVTGIDIAEVAIRRLSKAIEQEGLSGLADARVMNAESPDFAPGTFDIICCSGVLHHLDVSAAASSWASLLSDTGRLVMIEPMAMNPIIAIYRLLTPSMRSRDEHPLRPRDIATLRAHFRRVEVEGYVLTTLLSLIWLFVPGAKSLRKRSMNLLQGLDRLFLRALPALKYLCWAAVITAAEPREPSSPS